MTARLKAILCRLASVLPLCCASAIAQEAAHSSTQVDDAFFDADPVAVSSAHLALPAACGVPWLRCTAFGSVETRTAGLALRREDHRSARAAVRNTTLGMRFDFPDTRSAAHGPWFIQFKITRRTSGIKSWVPVPRHRAVTLTFGTEF